jgi:5'-3' exonuclease
MRVVFTLAKSNMLYGSLNRSLETAVTSYRKWFPFDKVYLVSDSKDKSWRKSLYTKYKENRKKDTDIDWNFVYTQYKEFKDNMSTKGFKILETSGIEGDDWISYITEISNKKGMSNIIVSNDHDIKQLLRYDTNDNYINIMTNEIFNKTKLFMPRNYEIFFNNLKKMDNNDIFNLNDNNDFLKLINGFIEQYEVQEINSIESLLIKIISGDTSDNIDSVWVTYTDTGKKRGIGQAGAESIVEQYIKEFGDPYLEDPDLDLNIADLVMEKRKVNSTYTNDILNNIKLNKQLVNLQLSNFPKETLKLMTDNFE